jgi:cytochrome P450
VITETFRPYGRRMRTILTTHADVTAVLSDPRFEVPPVVSTRGVDGMGWLRAHVSRFSTGAAHQRRRALAVAELDRLDPAALARLAAECARHGQPPDEVARVVPVRVLAEALGVGSAESLAGLVADVAAVARAYHPGTGDDSAADDAVGRLVHLLGGAPDEATAARIGLLVQACDATAGLIDNALLALRRGPWRAPLEAILTETLRHDPPVRLTRRIAVEPVRVGDVDLAVGNVVGLDLAAANRDPDVFGEPDRFDPQRPDGDRHLTFGTGLRPCPGCTHALAIAAAVLPTAAAVMTREDHRFGGLHPAQRAITHQNTDQRAMRPGC